MNDMVTVGISDLNVAHTPEILVTYALGSCVGICLYDPVMKLAGLSHILLPSSKQLSGAMAQKQEKFADTAINLLVNKMVATGASKIRLRAKIAGGAQMFSGLSNSALATIGQRNVQAVKEELSKLNIPIVAEDTGKDYGRTLFLNAQDGSMRIKSVNHGEWVW